MVQKRLSAWSNNRRIRMALWGCLFLIPLVFFSSKRQSWGQNRTLMILQDIIYPFEATWDLTLRQLNDFTSRYLFHVRLEEENRQLRKQVAQLRTRVFDYEEQALEIERLRKLLRFSEVIKQDLLAAHIIGSSQQAPFHLLRISRGLRHGVTIGQPVISPSGLVGRILRAGSFFADVQIVSDPNFSIDALVQRNRTRAILQGGGDGFCYIRLNRRTDIKMGDTLVSSGFSRTTPKGIAIGEVIKIIYQTDQVSQIVVVKPWVNYQQTEEVFVLNYENKQVATIKETVGDDWLKKSLPEEYKLEQL